MHIYDNVRSLIDLPMLALRNLSNEITSQQYDLRQIGCQG